MHVARPLDPLKLKGVLDTVEAAHAKLDGLVWLVSQPKLQGLVSTPTEGEKPGVVRIDPGDAWWVCVPEDKWPPGLAEELKPLWNETHGDRQTDLTLHGIKDEATLDALLKSLEACVLTEAEAAAEGAAEAAVEHDPFAEEWRQLLEASADAERAAKIQDDVRSAIVDRGSQKKAFTIGMQWCNPCVEPLCEGSCV